MLVHETYIRKYVFQLFVNAAVIFIFFFQNVLKRERHLTKYIVDADNQWCELSLQVYILSCMC